MQPGKILFLITKATRGGAQKYLYDLATHVPDEYEAVVVYGEKGRLAQDLSAANVRTIEVPSLGRNIALISDIRSFFRIRAIIRAERPQTVHLNSSKAAALGAIAARLSGVEKIVFTAHGWPFKENRNAVARILIYLVSYVTSLLSDHIIVVSKIDETLGKRMWGCGNKVRYIPLGIETPHFLSREEASATLHIATKGPRIVTNAELTKNKGLRYGIEAISILKSRGVDASYFLISDGEDRRMLEQLAQEHGVSENVKFLGFVPEAARYLKAFDLFLLPSIKEGMPYVLLEAAAANMPIITTRVVDPLFLGSYGRVRVVEPRDPEAIASAILETMQAREEDPLFPSQEGGAFSRMIEQTIALYAPTRGN